MKRQPAEISKYRKKFTLAPSELGIKAYYNIQYYKFSDELKKHKHLLHIYLAEPLKLSKIKPIIKLEDIALKKYFNTEGSIYKYNSISHTIVEIESIKRFVPDILMYRTLFQHKLEIETKLKMSIGQSICIFHPKVKDEILIIPPIAQHLIPNHDYGFVRSYKEALKMIDTRFNHVSPQIEGV